MKDNSFGSFQMTQNGTEEMDEATLLQDPDYKALVDYGINKTVAAELKKIYETGVCISNIIVVCSWCLVKSVRHAHCQLTMSTLM